MNGGAWRGPETREGESGERDSHSEVGTTDPKATIRTLQKRRDGPGCSYESVWAPVSPYQCLGACLLHMYMWDSVCETTHLF